MIVTYLLLENYIFAPPQLLMTRKIFFRIVHFFMTSKKMEVQNSSLFVKHKVYKLDQMSQSEPL